MSGVFICILDLAAASLYALTFKVIFRDKKNQEKHTRKQSS